MKYCRYFIYLSRSSHSTCVTLFIHAIFVSKQPTSCCCRQKLNYVAGETRHHMGPESHDAESKSGIGGIYDITEVILGLRSSNERRCYFVITSLIGCAQAQNQPCRYLNSILWIDLRMGSAHERRRYNVTSSLIC